MLIADLSSLADYNTDLPNIPIVLDNVMCDGSENSLLNCSHNRFTVHSCVHDKDIVLCCKGADNIVIIQCNYALI